MHVSADTDIQMHAHFLDLETPASSGRINSLPQSHTYLEGSERPTGSRSLSKCGSVGNLSLSLSFLLSALSLSSPFLSYLAVLSPPSPLFSPPVSFLPSALSDSVLLLQLQYSLCAPTRSVIVCYLGSLFPALPGGGYVALSLVFCLLGRSTAHCSSSLGCAPRSFYLVLESLFPSQDPALPPPIPPG